MYENKNESNQKKLEWNEAIITLERDDGKIKIHFNTESLEDTIHVFKTILTYMTYHPETIASVFNEDDDRNENYDDEAFNKETSDIEGD